MLKVDHNNNFNVLTTVGEMPFDKALGLIIKKNGRSYSRVAHEAGLSHPQLKRNVSIKTFLVVLDSLGYEIIIRKVSREKA